MADGKNPPLERERCKQVFTLNLVVKVLWFTPLPKDTLSPGGCFLLRLSFTEGVIRGEATPYIPSRALRPKGRDNVSLPISSLFNCF